MDFKPRLKIYSEFNGKDYKEVLNPKLLKMVVHVLAEHGIPFLAT